MPNKILINPSFCSFTSFWTVLLTPSNNKPESSRDFTVLIISPILSFDIIKIDAAAVIPKGIKTLLANGLIAFFINGNPVFNNGPSNLPRNPPDCIVLDN